MSMDQSRTDAFARISAVDRHSWDHVWSGDLKISDSSLLSDSRYKPINMLPIFRQTRQQRLWVKSGGSEVRDAGVHNR